MRLGPVAGLAPPTAFNLNVARWLEYLPSGRILGYRVDRLTRCVQTERFELVTSAGQRRAVLAADSSAFSIVLYGSHESHSTRAAVLMTPAARPTKAACMIHC